MLELLAGRQEDKYDILLDKVHTLMELAVDDSDSDHSDLFNEIVDFLLENFRINKSATMFMSLDLERINRESLLVLNSTNLVYAIINGLVRFSCKFSNTEGFKRFSDELQNVA